MLTSAKSYVRMSEAVQYDWRQERREGVRTAFVPQALHLLNYLQDLGYVGRRSGANGDK